MKCFVLTVYVLTVFVLTVSSASASVSASSGRTGNVRSFEASGAALAESVDADGTKRGQCAFADSDGQQIKVSYVQASVGAPSYTLLSGGGLDPAAAYQQCQKSYRHSQSMNAVRLQEFAALNPFAFGRFAPYGPAFGPDFGPAFGHENAMAYAAGGAFGAANIQNQVQRHLHNNMNLHNELMQQLVG